MKKFIALFMAVIMMLSFVSCGQQTEGKTSEYTRPDLSYWRENYGKANGEVHVGYYGFSGLVSRGEILQLIESVVYGREVAVHPLPANLQVSHSVNLQNYDENKSIHLIFYDDFAYVSLSESWSNIENIPLYQLENSEKCKQFFVDNGLYMPLETRTAIVDKISAIVLSGDLEKINQFSKPSGADGKTVNIIPTDKLERLDVFTVVPMDSAEYAYQVDVEIAYDYGSMQKIYHLFMYLDENYDIQTAYIVEDTINSEIINQRIIGGVDYSIWMQKVDNPVNNQFNYQLSGGGYGMGSSGMEWNTSIMRCIDSLQLGELVDINTKDYPYQQTYSIMLSESNPNYNAQPLIFSFYDDCNYLVICDCRDEMGHTVCDNHTQGYKVDNPDTVRQLFSMKGQYVPAETYKSLEKFADDYLKKTSVAKLNGVSSMDEEIPADYTLQGDITKLSAKEKANTEGKTKYSINFVAMYAGELPNGNRQFITYRIYMTVVKNGNSWQMEEMAISSY